MKSFSRWFARSSGHDRPHDWQAELAREQRCPDRLIRVPTGLGKTEGVLAAWAWNRIVRNSDEWPRRLIWCLPMRVLVEQTAEMARAFFASAIGESGEGIFPSVHRLLGGVEMDEWHLHPERPAVLVGTQDMLLSRALNRGYGAGRARWPVDYGLLNQDCLWVMDEIQLMDVGLATSVQLQSFRGAERDPHRPCRTWWMSATLKPAWLETVDSASWLPAVRDEMILAEPGEEPSPAWRAEKPVEVRAVPARSDKKAERLAEVLVEIHDAAARMTQGGRVTLAIVNRVDTATSLHHALKAALGEHDDPPDIRLIHSRFRGLERLNWSRDFLSRAACEDPATDRIIVATQVVEAGVDISATALVTELAPWPSLVQRFGRAARYGGEAMVQLVDREVDGKDALPYDDIALAAARKAVDHVSAVDLRSLERLEARLESNDEDLLDRMYPYEPLHLLTKRENDELFDTTPDLTGADLDISRFIRTGEDRDVSVCWVPVDEVPSDENGTPSPDVQPLRDGLCPVPVAKARSWLFQKRRLCEGCRAWSWDYVDGVWEQLRMDDCYPGQVLLVDAAWGGYDLERGFTGSKRRKGDPPVPTDGAYVDGTAPAGPVESERADRAQARDDLSQREHWKTIATHGGECADVVERIARDIGLADDLIRLLRLAARVHDLGKAHPVFQRSIRDSGAGSRPARGDLAKAPRDAWVALSNLYCTSEEHGPRRGFRHELATALALFEILRAEDREHPALLGPHRGLIEIGVLTPASVPPDAASGSSLGQELAALDAAEFDLLCHLVSAHHGKARGTWQSTPRDQEFDSTRASIGEGQPLNGVRTGDALAATDVLGRDGHPAPTPSLTLHLDPAYMGLSNRYGSSWSERLARLLRERGPFTLGYLEAVFRAADVRSSRLQTSDPRIPSATVPA